MPRIADILTSVNTIIANNGRWEESNLISLVDTAQKLIVRRTEILKKTITIPLVKGQADYALPTETNKIYRVIYKGRVIPIRTREYLDMNASPEWETHEGDSVETIITNLLAQPALRVYPIPRNIDEVEISGVFGIISDITSAAFNSVYGVVTDIELAELVGPTDVLSIYISYSPATVADSDDALEISSRYDLAIIHYVAGMALRQNEDTQSRTMAAEELNLFQVELNQIYSDSALSGTADKSSFVVPYRGAFDD